MNEYRLCIPGKPAVQKQTEVNKRWHYDPSKKDKEKIQWLIKKEPPESIFECPVEMTLIFYLPIPKGYSKDLTEKMYSNIILPDKRPDEDNMAYLVTNALKGLVYDDDSRICVKNVYKFYSSKPRTWVIVSALTDANDKLCEFIRDMYAAY